MSSAEKLDLRMTPAEYAVWEREQAERHEFFAGEVFSQAGGTRKHSLIGTNMVRAVGKRLEGDECIAHGSDMRIDIEATGYQAYPDVSVVRPPIEGRSDEVISNPVLIAEVLSPSTADFDRGAKFDYYRQVSSLVEYVVIWQDEPRLQQHTKIAEGNWLMRDIIGLDQEIRLSSINAAIPLSEIFDKVEFS